MPRNLTSFKLIRYLKLASFLCVIIISLIFVLISFQTILYPYGVNYGEAPIINQANRLLLGNEIYKNNFNSPPYIVTNYPPVFIYLLSFIKSNLGIQLFLGGRLISYISALIAGCVITVISYRLTKNYFIAAISLGFFFGHPYLISWSSITRVDLLALSLSLLGIYTILFNWEKNIGILLAVGLFSASIYTRQSFLLAGPLGASIWLIKNDRKKFYFFFLSLLLTTSSIFVYLNTLTGNGFFLNVVSANINDISATRLFTMLKNFIITWPIFISVAIFCLIYLLKESPYRGKNINNIPQIYYLFIPYLFGSFISTLTVGKIGSDVNYFLELIVALILIYPLIFNLIENKPSNLRIITNISFLFQFIWIIIIILDVNVQNVMKLKDDVGWHDNLYEEIEVATKEGIVLSDDYLDMVVIAGQQIYYQPFEYGQLSKAGLWDTDKLEIEIEEKKFPLIIIGGSELEKDCCWPEPISQAILNNYEITKTNRLLYFTPLK